jgi:hypothetical protein
MSPGLRVNVHADFKVNAQAPKYSPTQNSLKIKYTEEQAENPNFRIQPYTMHIAIVPSWSGKGGGGGGRETESAKIFFAE